MEVGRRGAEGGRGGAEGGRGGVEGGGGGAEGGSDEEPRMSTGQTYREYMAQKLVAWKEHHLKQGFKEADIPPMPHEDKPPPIVSPQPDKKQPCSLHKSYKKKRKGDYEPKDHLADLKKYRRQEEQKKRMDEMAEEGENFMQCIKVIPACAACACTLDVLWCQLPGDIWPLSSPILCYALLPHIPLCSPSPSSSLRPPLSPLSTVSRAPRTLFPTHWRRFSWHTAGAKDPTKCVEPSTTCGVSGPTV